MLVFHHHNACLNKSVQHRRKVYFGLSFQRFQGAIVWAYCFGLMAREHIMIVCGRGGCSPHGDQEVKSEEEARDPVLHLMAHSQRATFLLLAPPPEDFTALTVLWAGDQACSTQLFEGNIYKP